MKRRERRPSELLFDLPVELLELLAKALVVVFELSLGVSGSQPAQLHLDLASHLFRQPRAGPDVRVQS